MDEGVLDLVERVLIGEQVVGAADPVDEVDAGMNVIVTRLTRRNLAQQRRGQDRRHERQRNTAAAEFVSGPPCT